MAAGQEFQRAVARRRLRQWCLAPIVVITIGLGWRFPLLGFVVPLVVLAGVAGALVSGRYVCGNLCPRGSFLDRLIAPISARRPIPPVLRSPAVRWPLLAVLMGAMVLRIAQDPTNAAHWGRVFWLMCVVTTAAAVLFGILVHPRIWCAVCPSGTLQNAIGGGRKGYRIDGAACVECRRCEKACPMGLPVVAHRSAGVLAERDCLRCGECLAACPTAALKPAAGERNS